MNSNEDIRLSGNRRVTAQRLQDSIAENVADVQKGRVLVFNAPGDSDQVVIIAEFGGVRIGDSDVIKQAIIQHAGEVLDFSPHAVEVVRPEWLTLNAAGQVNRAAGIERYHHLLEKRLQGEIVLWGFDMNIPETEKDCFAYFGANSKIRLPVEVYGPSKIHIGNWVSFGRYGKILMQTDFSASIDQIRQHYPQVDIDGLDLSVFGKRDPFLKIGDGTTIGDNYLISCGLHIEIGRHVGIASRVFISDSLHFYEHPELPMLMQSNTLGKPLKIGDHSWIGINVAILEGANIGRHCIISANSVITGTVPDYSIMAGNPARLVKTIPH